MTDDEPLKSAAKQMEEHIRCLEILAKKAYGHMLAAQRNREAEESAHRDAIMYASEHYVSCDDLTLVLAASGYSEKMAAIIASDLIERPRPGQRPLHDPMADQIKDPVTTEAEEPVPTDPDAPISVDAERHTMPRKLGAGARPGESKYPLRQLQVGESFTFHASKMDSVTAISCKLAKMNGIQFTLRRISHSQARCWRIK
jgi:hypothetical protein